MTTINIAGEGVVVGPEDVLVIRVAPDDMLDLDGLTDTLHAMGLDGRVLVIAADADLAVMEDARPRHWATGMPTDQHWATGLPINKMGKHPLGKQCTCGSGWYGPPHAKWCALWFDPAKRRRDDEDHDHT